ncbi:MAG: hypothetical protein ABIX19_09380 [Gemmatimonadaceae bacterium]
MVLLAGTYAFRGTSTEDVLRVRGLVVVDSLGHERVVIGSPLARVSSNPRMQGAEGIVVLDSAGRLQTAIGYNTPLIFRTGAPGRRVGAATGLTFYDPRTGGERGGIGAMGDGRATACLDYGTKDKEAVCLAVAPDDQYGAVIVNGTPTEEAFDRIVMFAAADGSGSIKVFGGKQNRSGVMLRAGKGPASVTLYDSTGKAISP